MNNFASHCCIERVAIEVSMDVCAHMCAERDCMASVIEVDML